MINISAARPRLARLLNIHTIWIFFIFLIGLLFTLLVPPMQIPDEFVHFEKSLQISQGIFICPQTTFLIPAKYQAIYKVLEKYSLPFNYGNKFDYKEYYALLNKSADTSELREIGSSSSCTLPTAGYLVQALALKIANILNLNGLMSFYLGRFMMLMLFIGTLIISVSHLNSTNKNIILIYASIPMLLHQVGSYSYDSIQIIISIILFTLLLRFLNNKSIKHKEVLIYLILLSVLQLTKPTSYWVLLLTPLLFADKYFKSVNPRVFFATAIGFLFMVAGILALYFRHPVGVNSAIDAVYTTTSLQTQLVRNNPSQLVPVVDYSLNNYMESYAKMLLGTFGWLDYGMPYYLWLLILVVVIYVFSKTKFEDKVHFSLMKGLLIIFLLAAHFIMVVVGMYLSHSPHCCDIGGIISYGVQGRYFLLMVPMIAILFGLINQSKYLRNFLFICFLALLLIKLSEAVYLRYYDYQSIYEVPQIELSLPHKSSVVITPDQKSISDRTEFMLELNTERKLKGVTIGPFIAEDGMMMPYEYRVYKEQCEDGNNLLKSGFASKANLNNSQLTILFKKTIKPKDSISKICVSLSPFKNEFEKVPEIKPLRHENDPIIMPVYVR